MVKVSIIIPTYNRFARLKQVLAALCLQTYPLTDFEVIVVSDGSSDGTEAYLQTAELPFQTRLFQQQNQGPAAARNRGVAESTGDLLLFIDDDVVPAPQLIAEHVRTHENSSEDIVVIGPMLTPPDFEPSPWLQWMHERYIDQYMLMTTGKMQPSATQFYTGNASLKRHHFLAVRGFNTRFRRAEDVELAYRLEKHGLRFEFQAAAVGYHYEERSFSTWLDIPYAYGRNDVIFTQQCGEVRLLPTVFRQYYERHPVVRAIIRLCLDRPRLTNLVTTIMHKTLLWHKKLPDSNMLLRLAASTLFNLYQYQGVADELGNRTAFFAGVASEKPNAHVKSRQPSTSSILRQPDA